MDIGAENKFGENLLWFLDLPLWWWTIGFILGVWNYWNEIDL